ncbi:MAG: hypothetical protein HYU63_03080 [Armatimonadetes bacterium]|nr:hypothetical protein [Armatimonadota bacterium]
MLTRSIIFKGTRQGILAGINEEENIDNILEDFKEKIKENENFFKGSKISLDLG